MSKVIHKTHSVRSLFEEHVSAYNSVYYNYTENILINSSEKFHDSGIDYVPVHKGVVINTYTKYCIRVDHLIVFI